MRSINNFAKVEGHTSLIRDMSSHAILSTDDADFEAYKSRRDAQRKQKQMLDQQNKEIQSLKSDMEDIKAMLVLLLKGKE